MPTKQKRSGSIGGAADEAGGLYRRSVAALFVAYGLNGTPFLGLPIRETDAIVDAVALETDFAVDDLLVQFRVGRLFVQTKRTLNFGRPMREVTAQWVRALQDQRFRRTEDLIAAAAGNLSHSVLDAAEALDRLRDGATLFSSRQSCALSRLRDLLRTHGVLNSEVVESILSRAVILSLQAESVDHEHAERGRLLLDGHVVRKGHGARAWRELLTISGEAARSRLSYSIDVWLERLRRRQVPLTIDDEASRAAYLEKRRQAVERYRKQLQRSGDYVDLASIGLRIPPVALSEMDATIDVREPQADEQDSLDLFWSFRLCGRVVLTGLPGSGKSTVVARVVSEWARRCNWALPVAVSLRRVAEKERFRKQPLHDHILDIAVELVDPVDRPLVREALEGALSSGQAALFLDGLDEAADRSLDLASDIAKLLEEIHSDTDVLLATRDVAYADAQVLGFRDLRLCPPRETGRTVEAVLRAIASHESRADSDEWVGIRVEWVKRLMTVDSKLKETPLIPILLASLAADYQADQLPSTRSRILEQVVRNVVVKREVKREIRVSGIPPGHEKNIALEAFPIVASALEKGGGSATRADLAKPVGDYLQRNWGLAPSVARATADQLLVFWDESGIFVANSQQKIVSPRLRLFLEIGAALHAVSMPTDDATSWVGDIARKGNRGEILILAAGLSQIVAEALIDLACRGSEPLEDRLALEAAQALSEGGKARATRVGQLIERLMPIVRRGDPEAWSATQAITRIPVPTGVQAQVLDTVRASLPPEHALVASAQASLAWNWPADRRDEVLEQVLRVKRLPRLGPPSLLIDRTFTRVLVEAATMLLPSRPELAPVVAEATKHASWVGATELREVLLRYGHQEIAMESFRSTHESDFSEKMAKSFRRMDKDHDDILETLVQLSPHADLSLSQERRLSELASFVETLNLDDFSAWLSGDKWRALRSDWVHLIATLGGFDKSVVAKQAAVVRREAAVDPGGGHSPFGHLFAFATEADLNQWDKVSDVDGARSFLLRILHSGRGSALVAARALAEHPDAEGTAEAIRSTWDTLPRESVVFAVWAYLKLMGDDPGEVVSLAHSRNENVRQAVATIDTSVEAGRPTRVSLHLANDPVRQVRLAAIKQLEKMSGNPVSPEILSLPEDIRSSDDMPFKCHHCGTSCEAHHDSCPSCHIITQRPSVAAGESLKNLRLKAEGTSSCQ